MKTIKAVLFDVDGTLLDTTTFVLDAYKFTISQVGANVPDIDAIMKQLFGKPLTECYHILAPSHNNAMLCKIHDDWQYKNLHMVTPFATVAKTIEYLQKKDIKIAAVTNRLIASTKTILENSGMLSQMEAVIGFEDVINPKPDPEGLLKAAKLLQVDPAACVMVGDSEFDIIAGQIAGMMTIGIRSGLHPEAMEEAKPDHVVNEMYEMVEFI